MGWNIQWRNKFQNEILAYNASAWRRSKFQSRVCKTLQILQNEFGNIFSLSYTPHVIEHRTCHQKNIREVWRMFKQKHYFSANLGWDINFENLYLTMPYLQKSLQLLPVFDQVFVYLPSLRFMSYICLYSFGAPPAKFGGLGCFLAHSKFRVSILEKWRHMLSFSPLVYRWQNATSFVSS